MPRLSRSPIFADRWTLTYPSGKRIEALPTFQSACLVAKWFKEK